MKVNIWGFPYSLSGPAEHCKEFSRALSKQGADVAINSHFKGNWKFDSEIFELVNKQPYKNAIDVIMDPPSTWWSHMNEKHKALIGVTVFEGSQIGYDWALGIKQPEVDQIWCPSNHTKNSIEKGMESFFQEKQEKINVIPHGYDPKMFYPSDKKEDKLKYPEEDYFTFLFLGGWSQGKKDRKGLDIAYAAFCQEFSKKEPVKFLFKITSIYNPPGYNPLAQLQKIEETKKTEDYPILQSITQDVEKKQLANIYRCADVLVLPSKAEAFGMVGLEAMACGIPVITNNYGGQLDYINEDNGWIVKEGSFAPATDPLYIYDWADWFHPTIESWRKIMRKVYENKKEVEAKSKKSLETVKEFTWEKAGQKAIKLLEQY